MRILAVKQKSQEWLMARVGIPTASDFDKIITPAKGMLSDSSGRYLAAKVAEWMLGQPLEAGNSPWMQRGCELEGQAIAWYELRKDTDTEEVGFVLRDDGLVGASPDRFVGTDGGLEIKCPSAAQHVAYLLDPESLVADYRTQIQGTLWLTGRSWWDVLSYNPVLPQVLVRVEREEEFIVALADAVDTFVERLTEARARVVELGWRPPAPPGAGGERQWYIGGILALAARLKVDFGIEAFGPSVRLEDMSDEELAADYAALLAELKELETRKETA